MGKRNYPFIIGCFFRQATKVGQKLENLMQFLNARITYLPVSLQYLELIHFEVFTCTLFENLYSEAEAQ